LEDFVRRNITAWIANQDDLVEFEKKVEMLRFLGCNCDECDDGCNCASEGRRCTPLCAAHHCEGRDKIPCMQELCSGGMSEENGEVVTENLWTDFQGVFGKIVEY
jgi:hypothetical protein